MCKIESDSKLQTTLERFSTIRTVNLFAKQMRNMYYSNVKHSVKGDVERFFEGNQLRSGNELGTCEGDEFEQRLIIATGGGR